MKCIFPAILFALFLSNTLAGQGRAPAPKYNIPDLNKRATLLVRPTLPDLVMMEELDGKTISVRIVVDQSGNALSARAPITYSPTVRLAAEQAALESKFEPLVVKGKAERYFGSLQYSFVYDRMDWFAFGTALESVHSFDNLSVAPVAARLTIRWAEEKTKLADIDTLKDVNERIKAIAGMIAHFKSKLGTRESWLFSAGVVVRNATFWSMVGGRIDRNELQTAIAKIVSITKNIPPDIPGEFVENLKSISGYKIDPEMSEEDLRKAIFELQMKVRNYPQ